MEIRILPGAREHLPAVEELEKLCFSLPWPRSALESQLLAENSLFIAAEDSGGRLIGYAGMTSVLDEGYITNVAVAPKARRLGVGDRLVSALTAGAEERRLSFITLEVRAGNAAAIALYEKHGFKTVGLRKNYYDLPKEDALLMTLFLRGDTPC